MNSRVIKRVLMYVGLAAVAAAVLLPLARPGFVATDDGNWMVIRLTAFYQSFREGQFPVRFLGRLNNGYGYPVANFLYPGYLYLGSLLHIAGLSFTDAVEWIMAGSVLVTVVGLFVWLKRNFGSVPAGLGVVSYLVSPYLAYDIYKRGSVGEILAGAAAAVIFASSGTGFDWMAAPAVFLLILSHNTTAMLFVPLIVIWALMTKERRTLVSVFLGIMMAAFFWMPALLEERFVAFGSVSVSNPASYFRATQEIIVWYIGISVAVFALVTEQGKHKVRETVLFLGIALVATWMTTSASAILWKIPFLAATVQFPFRFLSLLWIAVPYLLARVIAGKDKRLLGIFAACALVPMALYSVPLAFRSKSDVYPIGYYTTNEATTTVQDEYMPAWVKDKPKKHPSQKLEFYSGTGTVETKTENSQKIDVRVTVPEDSVIQINTIFYPGWGATLDDKPVEISYTNSLGVMRIPVPKGEHHLYVEFHETVLRFAAGMVTVAAVGAWIFWLIGSFFFGFLRKRP